MAIVGGFLGGGVEMVPAGHGQLCIQWLTPDRNNISGASFTVSGTGYNQTVHAGTDGRAELVVPTGDYSVSVTHSGVYEGDKPQTVIVESTQSYLVLFGASTIQGGIIVPITLTGGTLVIVNPATQETIYNGAFTAQTINTGLGTFDITFTQAGITGSIQLPVAGLVQLDISNYIVELSCPASISAYVEQFYVAGTALGSSSPAKILKTSESKTVRLVLTESWTEGEKITFEKTSSLEQDVVIGDDYSVVFVLETSGNFEYPLSGTYEIALVGAGGGGGGGGGGGAAYIGSTYGAGGGGGGGGNGGGAGNLTAIRETHSKGDAVQVTIGSGGSGGLGGGAGTDGDAYSGSSGGSGGRTIFGTISANGGSCGYGAYGGKGGSSANKGAGVNCSDGNINQSSGYSYGGGGGGSGGLGGGGFGGNSTNPYTGSTGGTASIFGKNYRGGNGGGAGSGGDGNTSSSGESGRSGTSGKDSTYTESSWLREDSNNGRGGSGGNGGSGGGRSTYSWGGYSGHKGYGGYGVWFAVKKKSYGYGGNGGEGGRGGYANNSKKIIGDNGSAGSSGANGCVAMRVKL